MASLYISVAITNSDGDNVSRIIMFKARIQKSRDHYYIYVPKVWSEDLNEFYKNRKHVKVVIEID